MTTRQGDAVPAAAAQASSAVGAEGVATVGAPTAAGRPVTARARTARVRAWPLPVMGAVGGLAWASGLRGYMAQIAGSESAVEWYGTFEGILLPGLVTGALLGWAEYARRTGGRRGWRWTALAPLVFVLATPTVLVSIVSDGGLGGGALALPLFGMAGGYAMSGRGPLWGRILAGVFALAPIPGALILAALIAPEFSVAAPRGAWLTVLFLSFIAVLAFACAIPHRPVET